MTASSTASSPPPNLPFFTSLHRLVTISLLLVMFGLALGSTQQMAPAGPEPANLVQGIAFWRSGHLLPAEGPPLAHLLSGLTASLEPGLPDPASLAGWTRQDTGLLAHQFLWERGVNVGRLMLLARLPAIWLGMLTVALMWRWGHELYGRWGAAFAALLAAFEPNLIAHAEFATAATAAAFLMLATLYTWSRFRAHGRLGWLIVSGAALGLALGTSYFAVALLPVLLVTSLLMGRLTGGLTIRHPRLKPLFAAASRLSLGWAVSALLALLLMLLIGIAVFLLVMLATYRSPLPPAYFAGLRQFVVGTDRMYLLGTFIEPANRARWWFGPLVTLTTKLSLPMLIVFLFGSVLAASRRLKPRDWEIVVPNWLLLAAALLVPAGSEIRTLLPVILLIILFSARLAGEPLRSGWLRPALVVPFLLLSMAANITAYPHYLSYFNGLAARIGPARILVGSNLDWGQNLPDLARHLVTNPARPVFLSLNSQADPAYYGIEYNALPGQASLPIASGFHPLAPLPGLYAISATNLIGQSAELDDTFGYFRSRPPDDVIGSSIFLYRVDARAEAASPWFAQCALDRPFERPERLVMLTGENDLRLLTFDCRQSVPFFEGPGWLLLPAGINPVVDLGPVDYVARFPDGSPRYRVWQIDELPAIPTPSVEFPPAPLPIPIAGYVELVGYQIAESTADTPLTLVTWWRVRELPPPPVAIFAGLINGGQIPVTESERLGVSLETWQPGLIIAQQHTFATDEIPPGSYSLIVGLSVPGTSQRYPVSRSGDRVVDRIVLRSIEIGVGR